MDFRLPIALTIALAYSIWLAWSTLQDPENSEARLTRYAKYAFGIGVFFLATEILLYIRHMPLPAILQAQMTSTRSQGGLAFAYGCIIASGVFWIASTRSKS